MSRRTSHLACVLLLAAVVTACGSGVSEVSRGTIHGAGQRLTSLTSLDERVARVAFRLSTANADLCPAQRASAGWALHAANLYSRELRPVAVTRFGFEGDLPGVLAAPEGSAAARAGLRAGDVLLAVQGETLKQGARDAEPTYAGFAENVGRLDAALADGPVELAVRRNGAVTSVTVTPEPSCGYEVQLNPSDELNARADGRRLFISTALAGFTESDDELAVILGHELAHNVLGHREWDDVGGLGRTRNEPREAVEGGAGGQEQQADRVGLYLMARAGYDPGVAAPFWRRFGAANWRVRLPQWGHASAETRARRLDEVRAEIEARQAAGGPLLP